MNSSKKIGTENFSWIFDLTFLFIFIGGYFFLFLGAHHLLLPDEGRYAEIAREMIAHKNYLTPYLNGIVFLDKPILFYWLESFAFYIFGISEWSARLFPAFIGVLGCLFTYAAGRFLFNRRTGIISALILSTAPLYYALAHYVNMDLEVAVFISIALFSFMLAFLNGTKSPRSIFIWLFYAFIGLAFLTKGLIGIVFPAMIIGSWMILLNQWEVLKRMRLFEGLIIFLLITAPWYILEQRAIPQFWNYFFVDQQFLRYLTQDFNCQQSSFFYIFAILLGFIPWSVFLIQSFTFHIQRAFRDRKKYSIEIFLLLWVFIITLFFSIPKSKLVGYIIPIFPPLALLMGVYWDHFWHEKKRQGFLIGVLIYLVVVLLLPILGYVLSKYGARFHVLSHYQYLLSGMLILGALWSFISLKAKSLTHLWISFLITSGLFILVAVSLIPYLSLPSTKPIALWLKQNIQPKDTVIAFLDYYQDLPFYLKRKVFIAGDWAKLEKYDRDNWKHTFIVGATFQTSSKSQLMDLNTFQTLWNSNQRVFVVLNARKLPLLKSLTGESGHIVKDINDILLIRK
ncbi:MAG: glycosyltransferase family 39 protein [Gammaproteobacteria bacterium]|nr:glycosyltransferase family 39 protein [Gammaproteobacteria bacterium]